MWAQTYKKMLLPESNVCDTLSAKAAAITIYRKFDARLLEINLKFVQQSLSSILDALINCVSNI